MDSTGRAIKEAFMRKTTKKTTKTKSAGSKKRRTSR
jgi:hypothetical protein